MRLFVCAACGGTTYFDNISCVNCGHQLGFEPYGGTQVVVQDSGPFRLCARGLNEQVCNWVAVPGELLCVSCCMTRAQLNPQLPQSRPRWLRLEAAKRRLLYSLLMLGLPTDGLTFDFLSPEEGVVMTGHKLGVITINGAEADDEARERARNYFNESYRTLLGTFRHESGHYYWARLISPHTFRLEAFRALFGDESENYLEAIERHHSQGPAPDHMARGFISAYAQSHPWEDWAETWAHYLHMVDTMETARCFGMTVALLGQVPPALGLGRTPDFRRLLQDWVPITLALNSLNRSMGLPDLYPFVLSSPTVEKLVFIHETIGEYRGGAGPWPASVQLLGF